MLSRFAFWQITVKRDISSSGKREKPCWVLASECGHAVIVGTKHWNIGPTYTHTHTHTHTLKQPKAPSSPNSLQGPILNTFCISGVTQPMEKVLFPDQRPNPTSDCTYCSLKTYSKKYFKKRDIYIYRERERESEKIKQHSKHVMFRNRF